MSLQIEFDAIVHAMRKQGKPAMNGEHCAYLARDGSRCAIGCRIPDRFAPEKFHCRYWGLPAEVHTFLYEQAGMSEATDAEIDRLGVMYRRLQTAHDDSDPSNAKDWLRGFEANARLIADEFGLTYPE